MRNADRLNRFLQSHAPAADFKSRTIRGGMFAMAAEGVEFVLRLGGIIILARLLVPEYFGLIAMVTAITSVAERFKDLGLSIATVQRKEITYDQVSTLFWINAALGVGVSLLIAALAVPIARFYNDSRLVTICVAIASSFFFSGITIQHQALLRRQMRFGQLALIQISASAASVAIAVIMALLDYGYWALVGREVSRAVFMALGTWVCVPWLPSRPSRQAEVKSMLIFGGDVTAFNLVSLVVFSLDQILIGKLFGATPLGLYRQGINLVLAPITQLTFPIGTVAEAALSRLQDTADRYRRYYVHFLQALASVTMPLAVFLAVFADDVVVVMLGAKWVAAADYFRILAIVAVMRPVAATIGVVMMTCGKSRRFLWLGLFQSAILAACFGVGVQWGPKGIAYAHVVATYLLLVPSLYWAFQGTPITLAHFASGVRNPMLASLAMGAALLIFKYASLVDEPRYLLALSSAFAILVYPTVWLLLPGGRQALAQLVHYLLMLVRERRA